MALHQIALLIQQHYCFDDGHKNYINLRIFSFKILFEIKVRNFKIYFNGLTIKKCLEAVKILPTLSPAH